ncbi:aspartate kinase [Natronospirillum operosum]|uniref:aspartate kinase n=1 Tax=Natronospirillum operosum TaxID=2759953 RepID=A0A4Z0W7S0_9GAMM|nr:aspartate kinase [Natronospirillum operosum]TGG92777.1 aspartate kinase [Natronospirillum operosum]
MSEEAAQQQQSASQRLSVEKIGGTSMSEYAAVRDNIIKYDPDRLYNRIFVVSAYGGVTNLLLEHKKTGEPGVFELFANDDSDWAWGDALTRVSQHLCEINAKLFEDTPLLQQADQFVRERVEGVRSCLLDLQRLCSYGHFRLDEHLLTVRELLASLGEAHSAYNMTQLLQLEGINARFVDLTGWRDERELTLVERIQDAFRDVQTDSELSIVTGYAHCTEGLMRTFDRGYSEITFATIACEMDVDEAIIHKEYHLSSADPKVVGDGKVVPIGRTNYDVADQLSNLGMEAIHPKAARGMRQRDIPLRVKNTFEPEHTGTLITRDYTSETPRVEIIAGQPHLLAIQIFDQDMVGDRSRYEERLQDMIKRFKLRVLGRDSNANTLTAYVDCSLKTAKKVADNFSERIPSAQITSKKVAVVSAIGSDMEVTGLLAKTVKSLADREINVLAIHQGMRQVDIQIIVEEDKYVESVKALHGALIEPHNHEYAICAA